MENTNQTGALAVREEFGAKATTAIVETSASAVAARAKAEVEARYILAVNKPRNLDTVRVRMLAEAKRPGFAAVAIYHKPIGKGIEGPSIRLAEAALRCMGNVLPETTTVYDDPNKRIIRVSVTDLECNLTYAHEIVIEKTVERSKVQDGQTVVGTRKNSYGKTTYIVTATEDDLLNKQNALVSKALRTLALRILPGDILDEVMATVRAVREQGVRQDPAAARKALVDAFAAIGVLPDALAAYVGHQLDACSPAELLELRGVYAAVRDGEVRWVDALDAKRAERGEAEPPADEKAAAVKASRAEEVKSKLEARKVAIAGNQKPAATQQPPPEPHQ
jgi:hypothetical protein